MAWESTHHGKVAGSPVDMELAEEILWDGHLVGGCIIRHVQPFHVLYQGKLEILLSEQIIALCKQVSHQLLQKGLDNRERTNTTQVDIQRQERLHNFPFLSISFSKLLAH